MEVKFKTIAILICFTALTISIANAMDLKQFRETRKHPELKKSIEMYVGGVVDGFTWTNAELTYSGEKPFFCQPKDLTPNDFNFLDILDDEIKRYEKMGVLKSQLEKMSIVLILFEGLKYTFPCDK